MGLLDIFKEANEDAHGARLERGLQDTMSLLATLDDDIRVNALMRYMDKRNKLLSNIRNMTSKGCIDMGIFLQDEARKKYDTDLAESCALWMAGAWFESMERDSQSALAVYSSLNDLAEKLSDSEEDDNHDEDDFEEEDDEIVLLPSMPDITKCTPIEQFEIDDTYTAILVQNAPNFAGISGPVEYLYVMALFSENETLPIFYVTAEKGLTGSVFLCTFDHKGIHSNYGKDEDWSDINIFAEEALTILSN